MKLRHLDARRSGEPLVKLVGKVQWRAERGDAWRVAGVKGRLEARGNWHHDGPLPSISSTLSRRCAW